MTNPTPRELALVEAALEAAAEKCRKMVGLTRATPDHKCMAEACAAHVERLDPAAIVASVPVVKDSLITEQPEAAQDDRRKKWQELDYSFNAERAGLHTFHVDAFDAGLELAAEWHLLVIWLGCMFDFDTLGSVDEVAASAAARRDALAKSKKPVDQENARFAIEGAIEYGRRNINPPPSDDHWLAPFWNIGRQLGAPQERPEDERARFEYVERASNLKRDDCGDYENPCVQSAWEGWQAAKRDALTQAPQNHIPDAGEMVVPQQVEPTDAPSSFHDFALEAIGTVTLHDDAAGKALAQRYRALLSANQGK